QENDGCDHKSQSPFFVGISEGQTNPLISRQQKNLRRNHWVGREDKPRPTLVFSKEKKVMKALHDVKDTAALLAVSPWTVRAYIRDGKLKPIRLGRLVRLDEDEIQRFVRE